MQSTILVIEDDAGLQNYLKDLLLEHDFVVHTAGDGVIALSSLKKFEPDLVILDLGLPNLSGETVCLEIRKKYAKLPIIILTGRDGVADKVRGLNLGADDYITKPFIAEEFIARVNARLRKTEAAEEILQIADLTLNTKSLEVKRGDKLLQLTPKEYHLLQYLMSNQGRILTREMILNRIWLSSPDIETRVVDVYMGYLRKKVDMGFEKQLIQSVRGFGYTIKE